MNAVIKADKEQVSKLLDIKVISALALMLEKNDVRLQINILDAIKKLLEIEEKEVNIKFDSVGGVVMLGRLQQHSNSILANSAIKILDSFYSKE